MRHFERISVIYQGTAFECSGDWDAGEHFVDNLSVFIPLHELELYDLLSDKATEGITALVAQKLEEGYEVAR